MKAKLFKVLRLLKFDVLILGLLEKLFLGLSKKLAALKEFTDSLKRTIEAYQS